MSFTKNYLALMEDDKKKKKKKEAEKKTGHSFTDNYRSLAAEEDIAPVKSNTPLFTNKTAAFFDAPVTTVKAKEDYSPVLSDYLSKSDVAGSIGVKDATWWDATWKSMQRGYYNSLYGEETFAAMLGKENNADVYRKILEGEEYQFEADGLAKKTVSGAAELLGQMGRQFTNPDTMKVALAEAGLFAGGALAIGQAGPQIAAPEEILTVPGAAIAGFGHGMTIGSAKANLEIEAGHAYNEMIENGISEETAKNIALAVGGVNAGLDFLQVDELFKAFKVLNKTGATDTVVKRISKELLARGIDVAKETAQEVAQEGATIAGVQLANKKEKGEWAYTGEEVASRLGETAVSSALSFGVLNVPAGASHVSQIVSDNANAQKLTKNEQKVFDKEVANSIAEQEKDGKKLTNSEKKAIEKKVILDMEKGRISTDTIEEVLGGETYKTHTDTIAREKALQDEYDTLYKMKNGEKSDEQIDRQAELKKQLEDIKQNFNRNQLGDEVMSLVDGSRLAESYNERSRRGQAFEADISKYDAKMQPTIQKAIDSGILNNTNRTHEFVDMVAKITADKGVPFDFTNNENLKNSGFSIEGKTVNGFVTADGVTLNIDSAKALNRVVGHEITHVLEGTEMYTALQSVVTEYAKTKGEYQSRYDSLANLYEGIEGANIDAELTADLVGDYLFSDADFVNHLSVTNRNVFQKIYDEIKYLYKTATAGSKEARELERVKRVFEQAYRATKNTTKDGGVKYHISENFASEVDKALNNELAKNNQVKARDFTPEILVKNGVRDLPMLITQKHVRTTVYTEAEAMELGLPTGKNINYHGLGKDLLVQSIDNMDNPSAIYKQDDNHYLIITELQNKSGENIVIPVKIDGKGTYNDVYIDENQVLSAYGKKNLQSYLERNNFELVYTKKETALNEGVQYSNIGDFSANTLSHDQEDVKYSLADSDGKQLSTEQQDFFKDSKMRDENGNLKVMYHGSQDAGFHVFDSKFSDDDTSFFFVDRNDVAASYSGTSEVYEAKTIRSAEDMNNFLAEIGYDQYEAVEKNGKYELLENGDHVATSDTAQGLYEEFCWYEGVGEGDANYKVYLNLTNPLVVDVKGKNWNNISREFSQEVYDRYQSLTAEEKAALADLAEWGEYGIFKDEMLDARAVAGNSPLASAYEKLGGANANLYDAFSIASENFSEESLRQFAVKQMNTRDYAKKAKAEGYDGVIFKNIHDNGGYSNGSEGASTVAIAFDSNQIKSAANAKPTADADIRYSLSNAETNKNYLSAVEHGDMDTARKIMEQVAKRRGYTIHAYHGTSRGDRVGNVFLPERATSGPMAFFTDNKEIAENYSKSKQDTSMAYDPDYDRYETQFRIKAGTLDIPLYRAWGYLPFDARNRITKKAGQLRENWDGDNELILDPDTNEANGGFQWQLKEARGNAIQALTEQWLNSGNLFNEEAKFLDVLEMAGVTEEFKKIKGMGDLYFKDPNAKHEKVYDTFLRIRKPFETATVDEQFVADLEAWYEEQDQDRYVRENMESDLWDKNGIDAYDFAERLRRDIENNTAHAWTSIPDSVTDYLKHLGYDGIKDAGGKYGGDIHTVWIPFSSEQVKSAETVTYDDAGNVIPITDRFDKKEVDIRNSLSDVGDTPDNHGLAPLNKFKYSDTYGKDIALDVAPVREEVVAENATVEQMFPDDIAPVEQELDRLIQEQEALETLLQEMVEGGNFSSAEWDETNAKWSEVVDKIAALEAEAQEADAARVNSLGDADAPPAQEAQYSARQDDYVEDPFDGRDYSDVGKRNVKAYMYENPEVKPFFQEAAGWMLDDLYNSIKGERLYNGEVYYATGGEKGWGGTKRRTTDDIAYLLDSGYTYAEIEKGLNAIIEDNGAENNAVSKRIEFALNDRLLSGYKDIDGRQIPPSEEYINLLNEKQINEYSKESFDAFMANADRYAPVADDIAPVAKTAQTIDAPVAYEAIKPKTEREPRMAKATPAEQASAQVLVDEPKVDKKKPKAWTLFKDNFVDKGTVFETMSLKSGNRELQAKFKSIGRAESSAQWFMEHGNAETSSLKSIVDTVEQSGKTQQFYEYLYHLHNVDRMNLEERYDDAENKPVFGYNVTSDISKATAAKLEQANPEFKQWADSVYSYMNTLRGMLVDNGVISGETAALWAEMYPHYVPVRRMGDEGLNINVALDSNRTGINAPVKRATGGNRDILPLFDTMALRTEQTFKAIAKNRFGVELKNVLGTTIENGDVSVDEAIDSVEGELLQEGKDGRNPTFTVFEDGERVTFEITEEMYDTMKPKSKAMSYTNKVLNKANNVRRGLLTEYNPAFMLTNPIKDTQDVLINSQHPARTYANFPKAIAELIGKNGQYYQEYMEHGGEQNTYFDGETKTFTEKKSGLAKAIGFPLEKISQANNFIERIPRMAEYIASRKAGRSIDVSMLDAARVTTDFSAGGDLVRTLNRNGFTFLNASVQGAVQQVRNVREAKYQGAKGWAKLAAKVAVAGLSGALLNHLLWDDDDDYEELSDYVKQNYWIIAKYGDGKFVRIPKGRAVAVIQNAFEQMENLITGNDELDFDAFAELVISNLAPNNPLENNLIAPIMQAANNTTWYGDDLVPTRLQDVPAAEQFDETTDSLSKWLGEKLNISPYKINYVLDQYSGALGDTFLPMMTPEAERGNAKWWGDLIAPISDKFTTDGTLKNQSVSDFYTKKDELTVNANASGATDEDVLMSKYMNSVNADLAKLYAEKREIQNSNMPNAKKYEAVRDIQEQIVELTRDALGSYEDITFEDDYREVGEYARMNGKLYKLNKDGEWTKLSDEQATKYDVTKAAGNSSYATDGTNHYRWYVPGEDADEDTKPGWRKVTDNELERQNEVTKGLGISPETYWNNREEYGYAYDNPESYAVAKAVGGYEAYRNYSGDLYDIKADKDKYGKSISGSRKKKVLEYINNLDADYYTRIILWKSEYPSDDSYNYEIIDYINGRDDLSFEERIAALRKIGFNVTDGGDISW